MSLDSLTINLVTVVPAASYEPDAEGGMTPVMGTGTDRYASVQPARPNRTIDQGREGSKQTHIVYFSADPSVQEGYQILWGSRVFLVLGTAQDQAGRGVCFAVPCTERV